MFRSISWNQYWVTIATASIFYYIVILIRFYQAEIAMLLKGRVKSREMSSKTLDNNVPTAQKSSGLENTAQELIAELSNVFRQAARLHYPKEELLTALQVKIRDYKIIEGTSFQEVVNQHITVGSKSYCDVQLNTIELSQLW